MGELLNRLQYYGSNGLPPVPTLLNMGMPEFDETNVALDSHWTQFVEGVEVSSLMFF